MDKFLIRIKDSTAEFVVARENDQFVMEIFLQEGVDQEWMGQLNKYHLCLKALLLLDIVEADGSAILKSVWEGRPGEGNSFAWPNQGAPM